MIIEELLPLPHVAKTGVVKQDHLHGDVVARAGVELLNVHHKAAVARDAADGLSGAGIGGTHRRGEPEAHGTKAAGAEETARGLNTEVLRGPHLVLPHFSGDDGFALRQFMKRLQHLPGRDLAAVLMAGHRLLRTYLRQGLVPFAVIGDLFLHRLGEGLDNAGGISDKPDIGLYRLVNLRRVQFDMDDLRDGGEALDFIRASEYDAVVLDVMMPVMSGHEVVSRMRAEGSAVPVLFLTALDGVDDRVKGLDLGADDYLIKPFAFPELLARLRAITRKYAETKSTLLRVGGLVLDTASHRVSRDGRELSLSAKEFAVLEFMMRNSGVVLSRERIENNVWSYGYEGGSNVVDVYISYLRKKIDDGFEKKLLHTVWGSGWMLKAPE